MPPWPNFPPWPCLDSQLPINTELSLLCHNDESGRTLRLRTTCFVQLSWWTCTIYHKLLAGTPAETDDFTAIPVPTTCLPTLVCLNSAYPSFQSGGLGGLMSLVGDTWQLNFSRILFLWSWTGTYWDVDGRRRCRWVKSKQSLTPQAVDAKCFIFNGDCPKLHLRLLPGMCPEHCLQGVRLLLNVRVVLPNEVHTWRGIIQRQWKFPNVDLGSNRL